MDNSFITFNRSLFISKKCNEIFKCEKCNREFHTYENLQKHNKQKIDCINQKFKCNKCNKLFTANRNLLKHLRNIHGT